MWLEGFKRRGEPGKEWWRVPNLRSSSSECPGTNASSDIGHAKSHVSAMHKRACAMHKSARMAVSSLLSRQESCVIIIVMV